MYLTHGQTILLVELMDVFAELIDFIWDIVSKLLLSGTLSTACLWAKGCLTA